MVFDPFDYATYPESELYSSPFFILRDDTERLSNRGGMFYALTDEESSMPTDGAVIFKQARYRILREMPDGYYVVGIKPSSSTPLFTYRDKEWLLKTLKQDR